MIIKNNKIFNDPDINTDIETDIETKTDIGTDIETNVETIYSNTHIITINNNNIHENYECVYCEFYTYINHHFGIKFYCILYYICIISFIIYILLENK